MADIVTAHRVGAGVQVSLADGVDAIVMNNIAVHSTNSVSISGAGSGHTVDVLGTVSSEAARAISLGSIASTGNRVNIASTGSVYAFSASAAVGVAGDAGRIDNLGTIQGNSVGIVIGGDDPASFSRVLNKGYIEGGSQGILRISGATGGISIDNRGEIFSDTIAYQGDNGGDSGVDKILNSGIITGNILLGGGDDFFDTRSGKFVGDADGGAGEDTLQGSSKADTLGGGADNDKVYGNGGNDVLNGGDGDDYLSGGDGSDKITGGLGKDELRGGSGADAFVFKATAESTMAAAGQDLIVDFSQTQKDKIDLSAIDAKASTVIDNSFTFIGTKSYSQKEGELKYKISGGDTLIYGDIDGDGASDFKIVLDGTFTLKASDFIL